MALPRAQPGTIVDLRSLGEASASFSAVALVKTASFEAVRMIVPAGREIPAHRIPGHITLHCLEGRLLLRMPDTEVEMTAGDWIYLEGGVSHSLTGIENSALLLTIMFGR